VKAPSTGTTILAILVATILLVLSGTMAWATVNDYAERVAVPMGVSVADADLSGMTEAQARDAVEQAVAALGDIGLVVGTLDDGHVAGGVLQHAAHRELRDPQHRQAIDARRAVRSIGPEGLVLVQEVTDPLSPVKQREVRKGLHGTDEGK